MSSFFILLGKDILPGSKEGRDRCREKNLWEKKVHKSNGEGVRARLCVWLTLLSRRAKEGQAGEKYSRMSSLHPGKRFLCTSHFCSAPNHGNNTVHQPSGVTAIANPLHLTLHLLCTTVLSHKLSKRGSFLLTDLMVLFHYTLPAQHKQHTSFWY